jgi:hypothetical protein
MGCRRWPWPSPGTNSNRGAKPHPARAGRRTHRATIAQWMSRSPRAAPATYGNYGTAARPIGLTHPPIHPSIHPSTHPSSSPTHPLTHSLTPPRRAGPRRAGGGGRRLGPSCPPSTRAACVAARGAERAAPVGGRIDLSGERASRRARGG